MQIISTRAHGAMDYAMAVLLIASPWLFDFADGGIAQWLPVVLGLMLASYSLLTNYELGIVRVIPMPLHLGLDLLSGVLLAASPWVFGFADKVYFPHLILGIIEVGAALLTDRGTHTGGVGVAGQAK